MARPMALAKLPSALRDKSGKVTDPGIAHYLAQAATAIEKQNKKIQLLHNRCSTQKYLIDKLQNGAPPKPVKRRDRYEEAPAGDWWDAEPDDLEEW